MILFGLPDDLQVIGSEAFSECRFSLQTQYLRLPLQLQQISLTAFYNCGIHSFEVPNPATEILEPRISEYNAFQSMISGLMLRGYSGSTAQAFAENPDHSCLFISIDETAAG